MAEDDFVHVEDLVPSLEELFTSEAEKPRQIEVCKRKATTFFKPEFRPRITEAVNRVHQIAGRASFLLKLYYLTCLDTKPDWKGVIDKDLIWACIKVAQGQVHHTRGNSAEGCKIAKYVTEISACANDASLPPLQFSGDDINITRILQERVTTMLTSYKNNTVHYSKYIVRFILCKLLVSLGVTTFGSATKQTKALAYKIAAHVLSPTTRNNPEGHTLDIADIRTTVFVPEKTTHRGWRILQRMVKINRCLEADFTSLQFIPLFSPLCLVSTLIPGFIRINTGALLDLMLSDDKEHDKHILFLRKVMRLTRPLPVAYIHCSKI
jgi:hypothetical protein